MAKDETPHFLTPFVAGILAWIMPGAGHVYLGRTVRGVILCVCINGLFWAGVAVGGVFTVEPRGERWWFIAQMFTGASGTTAWYRQKNAHHDALAKAEKLIEDSGESMGQREAYTRILVANKLALSYPSDTVARAYSGVAGMLNLMCIFDAFMLAAIGAGGEPEPDKPKPLRQPMEGAA